MYKTLLFLTISIKVALAVDVQTDSLENKLKGSAGTDRIKILNRLFDKYISHDPVKAAAYTKEALSIATERKDSAGIAVSFRNLGIAYKNHGALDNALENFLQAEGIYIKLKDKEGVSECQNEIGTIYSSRKDYALASRYFTEALGYFQLTKDSLRMADAMNNLGEALADQNENTKALEYFIKSAEVYKGLDKEGIDPLINIGELYLKLNDHAKAIEYLKKASEEAQSIQDQLSLLAIQAALGDAWLRAGDLKTSEDFLKDALRICQTTESYFYEPGILKNLAINYSKQGKLKEAFDYFIRYDEAREKVYSEESSRHISQMEMALDIHTKEQEIEELKKDEALKDLRLQRTQLAITLLVLGVLTAVLLVNYYLQRKKKR